MNYTLPLYSLIICSVHVNAQNFTIPEKSIPITHSDFSEWVLVYNDDIKSSKLEDDKTYYWLKAKHIHTSKGGYKGHLLHGEYTALYKDNALKEKGEFYKGLKSGEWKTWYPNGELMQITHWRKGKISGAITYFNTSGKQVKRELYKSGLQHGKQIDYTDSSEVVTKFRNGKKIVKRIKTKKTKVEKAEEIIEPNKKETEEKPIEPIKNKRTKKVNQEKPKEEDKKQTDKPTDKATKKSNKKKVEKV